MWCIVKSSRTPTGPYSGPTCIHAGIEPGKWYQFKEQAEQDAALLSSYNPVGFNVYHETELFTKTN